MLPTTNRSKYSSMTNSNNVYISYETTILGHEIELVASGPENDLCVEFFVDDSTTRKELPTATRMKITRFLFEAWKDLETRSTSFYCDPVGGKGGWRAKLYQRLGFEYSASEFVYIYSK